MLLELESFEENDDTGVLVADGNSFCRVSTALTFSALEVDELLAALLQRSTASLLLPTVAS